MSIRVTGMNSGMDTDAMVKELVSAYQKKGDKTVKEKTKLEWKQEIWTDLNKKIKSFATKVRSFRFESNYAQKKTTSSDESKVSVIAGDNAVRGSQTIEVLKTASTAFVTSGALKTEEGGKVTANTKLSELGIDGADGTITLNKGDKAITIEVGADTTVGEFVKKVRAAGLDASLDEGNGRMFIGAKESGLANDFSFSGDSLILDKLGLGSTASVVKGEDAEILLNGAKFTSNSNSFDINGMAISVKAQTKEGEKITLTTDTDTDAIYKNIKGIIKAYSELVNELSKLYNASSAKDFEPLTDDEKEAMSEDEIEKWETKIKDSLLRRDSNVSAVKNAMTQTSLTAFNVNGKKMTLSDFGIGTLGYFTAADNEKSALHIDGDEEDDEVSGKTNKLKQMLVSDPDAVAGFFSQYMQAMTDNLDKISKSTENRSYGSFFDDKKVKKDMDNYSKKITEWEEYVKDIEDKYYKQFTSMETQLAKLNSTQSNLASYFGQ